ncbi:unnamed protein product [Urochloa humidicola]
MMQSCEGAMKSLRSDACSAGENLLDDIPGRVARNRLPERSGRSSPPPGREEPIRPA